MELIGRAWSGGGVPMARVAVGVDGTWSDAALDPRKAAMHGAAGGFAGTQTGRSTCWNAAPPMRTATPSRLIRHGTPSASATMPCIACTVTVR